MGLILVPQSGQTLGGTRSSILSNFTVISEDFQVDHVAYSTTGEGQHQQITMPLSAGDVATAAGIIELYSKNFDPGTGTAVPTLFFRPQNSGTPIPLTGAYHHNPGWAYLPSGILFKWGIQTVNFVTSGTQIIGTITFDTTAPTPAFNHIYSANINLTNNTQPPQLIEAYIVTLQTTTITLSFSGLSPFQVPGMRAVYYFAIGD